MGAVIAFLKGFPNCLRSEQRFRCHFHCEIQATRCLMSTVAEVGLLPAENVASATVMSPVTELTTFVPQWFSSAHSFPEISTPCRPLPCCVRDLCSSISPPLCSCKNKRVSVLLWYWFKCKVFFLFGSLPAMDCTDSRISCLHATAYNTLEVVWLYARAQISIPVWPLPSWPCGAAALTSCSGNRWVSRRQRFSNNWRWQLIHHGRGIRSTE